MPHLVLIDGPNYVFRAFHAVRHNLTNSKGEPTNAVFGYVQMLRSILKELGPTHVAVAFDPKGGTFRNRMYADYKAHRPPMPEDLAAQWPTVFDITDAFRLNRICVEDYEADDVIATLARQAEARGWDVSIVSTDKDLMQLVGERVWMLDTMKRKDYGPEEVKERWGVGPDRIQDLLALAGDSADNIPGVPGIGPKTAVTLLEAYGDLEGVLNHAAEIKQQKRRENLIAFAEDARLSYRLVALDEQVPLAISLDDLAVMAPDRERLAELFTQLEFRRMLAEFSDLPAAAEAAGEAVKQAPVSTPETIPAVVDNAPRIDHLVDNESSLQALLAVLAGADMIALDTETTSLQTHDAELVGLSFATRPGEAWYIPVGHRSTDLLVPAPTQLPLAHVLDSLRPILEASSRPKCGHNLKYDAQVLRRAGIVLAGISADSMLLAYCLYPAKYPPKLDSVAEDYLSHHCTAYAEVAGKGAKQVCFDEVPVSVAAPYACEDAEVSLRLTRHLGDLLQQENRLPRHDDIELPLSLVLADMEWTGARVDAEMLAKLSSRFGLRIAELESQIHAAAGEVFNIQSPKQLGVLLFETLAIPGGKKTKSGQWATGQEVLEKLADEHEVPSLILQVRQLAKLKSTYSDALPKLIHPKTSRVHTSFNQAITTTGRLSSSDPNLQNIPIRSVEGREIRKAFIAEDGCMLLAADYSQIELRLMAHFSGDATLCAAFANGEDIHAATAATVNGIALADVSGEMRRRAKAINFGILYGMSAFGLAKQLNMARGEAQQFIDTYFERYPSVRGFMDETLILAREQGYVETLLGHRVYVPEITSSNGMRRAYAERTAINAPLQGSAADIIKVAMINLHRRLQQEAPAAVIILQVHDELIVEAPADQIDAVSAIMRQTMEQAVTLSVPLTVDIGTGHSWYDAHGL
ncbi:MAG: DNA polymerase I [Zetaproteobacteria bacterium CG12_big_fil_rev_8_21_14_0_65_54_13]|nr:MAG: DNA polymerase I [Zetaproteobacteria bacterium CG1_02_53_45]PIW47554.1 MAG: DNA polymerase I [Zetaproteobacteria bacterium CG12_big_fil_rev_8_21_14_0_65_54_13]PIX55207.1 MAG: DNA polymerase I [Zetaproteobacteria bacterium CG_4_10_14_3_um_filter_54_28]PJA28089.1 MAG: DNA polymerase I [Zetaproteobacteria bacterium CG_4_9_14_3_um_filter_54_145]